MSSQTPVFGRSSLTPKTIPSPSAVSSEAARKMLSSSGPAFGNLPPSKPPGPGITWQRRAAQSVHGRDESKEASSDEEGASVNKASDFWRLRAADIIRERELSEESSDEEGASVIKSSKLSTDKGPEQIQSQSFQSSVRSLPVDSKLPDGSAPLRSASLKPNTVSPSPFVGSKSFMNSSKSTSGANRVNSSLQGNTAKDTEAIQSPEVVKYVIHKAAASEPETPLKANGDLDHSLSSSVQESQRQVADQRASSQHSFEEPRLTIHLDDATQKQNDSAKAPSAAQPKKLHHELSPLVNKRTGRARLQLFKGPGIEVVVGARLDTSGPANSIETWSLPKALISHYSSTLKDACNRPPDDPQSPNITFLDEDPAVFELFVEWIYDGIYTLESPLPATTDSDVSIDVQAWILGDRLGSPSFKNYAMTHLHDQHKSTANPVPITPSDVDYAFTHSAEKSMLQVLFTHLLILWFLTPARTVGTAEQWDEVLQKHRRLRVILMRNLRSATLRHGPLNSVAYFLEGEGAASLGDTQAATCTAVTPAKRNADGLPVNKSSMEA